MDTDCNGFPGTEPEHTSGLVGGNAAQWSTSELGIPRWRLAVRRGGAGNAGRVQNGGPAAAAREAS
jgi:hypothetical protein